ncbi:bifunctional pyr operon transcriptional regulator/uracil phosphoribosyltransferase PyrR [Flavilitoribacter nigricans]|uniref:Bifunctional pyr operon transcriptional regulator/uracil phosphoribosyltransferase n=1 Tax=Flavilitoribacter nigricans (strain ATCC 23147 / DSM 23189 / NBRC 102662 / NCIMB 1420 / SS-2) TaxID=1122177 RepID=A0A2D0NGJ2_FLAN2|nr:bifunctional pyr operon transcriptional regulator/uracil phosphoribosyltransferase PyrR [Flavilitoribacter nigricans]PHN07624.1 bifunctional pyr operon transcriptional regulator/uracil phosphoribosyltransferase [Flavilitoribacter nigricans DSM 23189 = NBRC 102662]
MDASRTILAAEPFALTIERLCHQLIEAHDEFDNTCFVGIQEGGVALGDRLVTRLSEILGGKKLLYGKMDITFYRDDFRTRDKPLRANRTEMNFIVDGKNVILLDDVLYTGRTVQAALTALNHYGRPEQVELVALVDRRFNRHLPIQSDYIGVTVDSLDDAYVRVEWAEVDGEDRILILADKE